MARQIRQDTPRLLRQHSKTHRRILSSVATSLHFQSPAFSGPPILLKKKLNYVLLCFIKLQFKPKCHGIDTIMYNSLIPFANFGSSQYSILKLIAIHNLACSYVISPVHNIRGKGPGFPVLQHYHTGISSIVQCYYQYCNINNTNISSIVNIIILVIPVL